MIKELYERLRLRYQIYLVDKELNEIELDRALVRFPRSYPNAPLSTLSAAAAMASFDYLDSLKTDEAGLLSKKHGLETRLDTLLQN